jgi:excisionase family DNA binding protein
MSYRAAVPRLPTAAARKRDMGKKISMDAAADQLGVCKRTIERFIEIGELPAYKIGTKLVRVDTDDVAGMLKPITSGTSPSR